MFQSRWEGMTGIVQNLYGLETLSSFTDSRAIVGSMDIAAFQNLTGMGVLCESPSLRNYTFQSGEVLLTPVYKPPEQYTTPQNTNSRVRRRLDMTTLPISCPECSREARSCARCSRSKSGRGPVTTGIIVG